MLAVHQLLKYPDSTAFPRHASCPASDAFISGLTVPP
jgi:hypothetical protein